MAKRIKEVHPAIREALGYSLDEPVADILKDWRERTSRVCKPCWELKYCPYGPLVEQLPLLPTDLESARSSHDYFKSCLESGLIGEILELDEDDRDRFEDVLRDDEFAWQRAHYEVTWEMEAAEMDQAKDPLLALIGGPLPPPHVYRIAYELDGSAPPNKAGIAPELNDRIDAKVLEIRSQARLALETGIEDSRKPLDAGRRAFFERSVAGFNPDAHPEFTPEIFAEASCNVFGHICPVFFAAEAFTETSEDRRRGRYIPFHIKMRVVRRDNHTCQECGVHLRDDEVEFDHIIPLSKGGSTEEHNLRLTCFDCNRGKSARIAL